jgi:hypothetical protein
MTIALLIFLAGVGQLAVLVASALVPFQLEWRKELSALPHLHRQMFWVYGGYVAMSIVAFGLVSVINAHELAGGTPLARAVCAYIAVFWGVRLGLQAVFDTSGYLTRWWIRAGYTILTILFATFTIIYAWVALHSTAR